MDSLTQVVLGAAVGEAVLGRKVGNRAMVWGGLAGTLPDLDVLSGLVTDPMSALAYHRAFTHSLSFAILAAPLLGVAVYRLYGGRGGPKLTAGLLIPLCVGLFWLLLLVGSYLMPIAVYGIPAIVTVVAGAFILLAGVVVLLQKWRGTLTGGPNASLAGWIALFFGCIVTHPLLDCFTSYGTQFLEPLSKVRLAWNTVSVIDPLYTLPFLLLLVLAARFGRRARERSRLNRAGLVISTAYLVLTVFNAFRVGQVVEATIAREELPVARSFYGPTLGNNILWTATLQDTADNYYLGQYSFLDAERKLDPLREVPGNHDKVQAYLADRDMQILTWFTDGYYTVLPGGEGRVVLCDLRYGLLGRDPLDPGSYTFNWTIDTVGRPARVVPDVNSPRPDMKSALSDLWERLKGLK